MSHTITVKACEKITDLAALKAGAALLGLEFLTAEELDQPAGYLRYRGWYGASQNSYAVALIRMSQDQARRVNYDFDIGIAPAGDGYVLKYDNYGGVSNGIERFVGDKCAKLFQTYKTMLVKMQAEQMGYGVQVQEQDGNYLIAVDQENHELQRL